MQSNTDFHALIKEYVHTGLQIKQENHFKATGQSTLNKFFPNLPKDPNEKPGKSLGTNQRTENKQRSKIPLPQEEQEEQEEERAVVQEEEERAVMVQMMQKTAMKVVMAVMVQRTGTAVIVIASRIVQKLTINLMRKEML